MTAVPPSDLFTLVAAGTALVAAGVLVVTGVMALREARRPPEPVRRAASGLVSVCTPERVDALLGRGANGWREALELTLAAIGDDPRAQILSAFLVRRSTPDLERLIRAQASHFPSGRAGDDVRDALTALCR